MKKFRLKAYTKHGLITSKLMYYDSQIENALLELALYTTISKVYKTDGVKSYQLKYSIKKPLTRPTHYTRSDGMKTLTLSIHPSNYPMTAHYANGITETISL